MDFNTANAKGLLERFDFMTLFVNELGWDRHSAALPIEISGTSYGLKAIAEKRGMVAWLCDAPADRSIPDRATRKKIEHQVAKTTLEHLIIFTDAKRAEQVWCWARRETGKPASVPEHFWYASSGNRGFLQKLAAIAFSLEEEESLTLVDVTARARVAFDVERVTKRFYDQFKTEHKTFLDFIEGITDVADREWYASLMLNRLMFIYFMQRKGFLNGERDYLRNRLEQCRKEKGRDKFYSFYSYFLLRLFHEGLGGKKRNTELENLLGRIPYLNGGLFEPHPIEEQYPKIAIPDEAFTRIFNYFDRYQWHLDERPLRNDNEINPDVLGYIFEKYINQKQMGAYYTKEDITEYISKNTVIPFLFDAAKAKCKVAFESPGGPTIWDHLRDDPDRYIYAAVKHGAEQALPPEIAAGIEDVSARTQWNQKAPAEFALPTEIWREVVARRARYAKVRAELAAGEVREINDLITLNLDIRQFAQDVIERSEGPELLRAFWKSIEGVTVLDPTCGSGAFLFAALNILEPLYETCLDRMEAFVADLDRADPQHDPKKFKDFKDTLAKVAVHPNARYFTLKSIILNNLFGVDIMEEAVEICKLRMFLKLAAQVDPDLSHENLGIEPLPDIDFNVRAGNTLVGYATYDDVKAALMSKLDLDNALDAISASAADLQQTFDAFRARQMEGDGSVPSGDKTILRQRLTKLKNELDRHLAAEFGVNSANTSAYASWLKSHEPFHWFVEYHGIMQNGGFDVLIGNPPYVAAPKVRKLYNVRGLRTTDAPDIYAWVLERATNLLAATGRSGMIVPLSLTFSAEFDSVRKLLYSSYAANWFSSFGRIPAALFSHDVRVRNTIHLGTKAADRPLNHTTRLHRWFDAYRSSLLPMMSYGAFQPSLWGSRVPKLESQPLIAAYEAQLQNPQNRMDRIVSKRSTRYALNFKKTAYNWLNYCRELPPCYDSAGKRVEHTKFGRLFFESEEDQELGMLIANGKLMLIYWFAIGDDFDVTRWNFTEFPMSMSQLTREQRLGLRALVSDLESAMSANIQFKLNAGKRVGNFNLARCRDVTDRSDRLFASAIGFDRLWDDIELYYNQTVRTDFSDDLEEE
ncbi:MAG: Eco57I restriction-modification methylase domain-containing protein [Maricaulaceae bacterium]|nr:Eco57I restriction-modification methylase domain-containing protein [Maricaulaceae bacterium]